MSKIKTTLLVLLMETILPNIVFAGVTTSFNNNVTLQGATSIWEQGNGAGDFGRINLASTNWNNSATIGSINSLNVSYDTIGQTGTYSFCEIPNPFGGCIHSIELPSIGTIHNNVNLGSYGMALPVSTSGNASLDLSYRNTLGLAKIKETYNTGVTLTQVGSSIYRIDTAAADNIATSSSLESTAGLPEAKLDLSYDIYARIGGLEVCAGGCAKRLTISEHTIK